MVKIFNSKYISEFPDDCHLQSYENVEIPEGTVRYLNFDFNPCFYVCTSSSKRLRFHELNKYGMKGDYRTYWRKIEYWDRIIKKEEKVGS